MKKLIYNTKRFIHSLKVRWKIRKTPKFMRKFAYWWHMAAYDMAQVLKGVRPMTGDTLDSMADMVGIERQEGETDEELRKRIIEIVKKKGVSKAEELIDPAEINERMLQLQRWILPDQARGPAACQPRAQSPGREMGRAEPPASILDGDPRRGIRGILPGRKRDRV